MLVNGYIVLKSPSMKHRKIKRKKEETVIKIHRE